MGIFLVFIIAIGWVFAQTYRSPSYLYGAVILSMLMNVFSYWYSDKIALMSTGAKEANRDEYFGLYTTVENLSITAGIPMPRVYVIDDPAPNAFATGRNKEHAVIAVTTGLLGMTENEELEGVLAHEMAHIGNRDILLMTVVVVLVGFISILADMFMRARLYGVGGRGNGDSRAGAVIFIAGIVLSILAPIAATLIQLAISRKREYLADATGALITRYPDGLANALEKISKYDGRMKMASAATAHLFISDPFGSKKHRSFAHLFMTHPPIEERISILRNMGSK